ncbi:MAG TPA: hypothetical protein VFS40_15645, partial [Gemmatimonadales bacterium]|nr:hypothetical protein [Gemmatimonadales bacterium]
MPARAMRRVLLGLLVGPTLPLGAARAAQAPTDALAAAAPAETGAPAFVDSVRRVTDTLALLRGLDAVGREPGGTSAARTWRESRQGWLLLRLGELGEGRARLDEAIRHFDEAIYRDKTQADPWVGLAEAKLLLDERHAVVKESMHQPAGTYYEDAALQHLLTALRLQPTYPAAVALLARILVGFDAPPLPSELVEGLRLAAAHAENGPLPPLLLGRWLRKPQRSLAPPALDSAAAAFHRYAALGGDRGLAELELARVAYKRGRPDSAVALYLAGAAHGDTLARAAFRRDLTWIADSAKLEAFDRAPADSVGAWVR